MLENEYGLLHNIRNFNKVLATATDYAEFSQKEEWREKRAHYYERVGDANSQIAEMLEKG